MIDKITDEDLNLITHVRMELNSDQIFSPLLNFLLISISLVKISPSTQLPLPSTDRWRNFGRW